MTRARRWLLAIAAVALLLALALWFVSRPQRVASLVMSQLGSALGLEITARGVSEYTLAGGPRLVLRDVEARAHGASRPLLHADRVDVSVPWSTVRTRGADLAIKRIELDTPVLDVPMLQAWLASRPPSEESKMPTLSDGLRVRDGRVVGAGWSIDAIALDVPRVMPGKPVEAQTSGRYVARDTRVPFELALKMTQPANDAGLGAHGTITLEQPGRRMPATVRVSGPLHFDDHGVRIAPLRASIAARYTQKDVDLPFAFALNGPLRYEGGAVSLSPAGLALRGKGLVPNFDGRAAFAYTDKAMLHLAGTLATWPDAWPALPPPIGQSTSPLPVVLDYAGPFDFSDVARLQLTRDATRLDARFALPAVLSWIDAAQSSPLPPLSGRLTTPTLDIGGAVLEGVDVRMHDPALDTAAP
ncbi:AsmA family protein [Lysobacter dokdonensis DS-58]|uniref:AsmA family protein n=1 Tax=Lysobacter dokdonensis DS-58 TaxID=1300345 RepID=A0A0A2WJW7_9GAMM|nr:hypothetical protein [Lysobacter dokdonensis]KGQ18545.1 AsmA family protein [Lysobacter dokdonensis DS-58]